MKKTAGLATSWLGVLLALGGPWALAAEAPLPVDANTIGLWNFNSDVGTTVVDSATNPLNGTASSSVVLVAGGIPGLTGFGPARQFVDSTSFVSLGRVAGSKLDFLDSTAASIEAMISLSDPAPNSARGIHIIYDNSQIQLMVIVDKLAAFVRQTGGFKGVVAKNPLPLNTPLRATMSFAEGQLGIFVNGQSVGRVTIPEPIAADTSNPNVNAFIGGSVLSQFFPGYIDDVRVSDSARFDLAPPVVALVAPSPSVPLSTAFPDFEITYQDRGTSGHLSGIDAASVVVFLNGRIQTGIPRDATGIRGRMDDGLMPGIANEVRVVVADNIGNEADTRFFLTFTKAGPVKEYDPDADTLALWHMNEQTPLRMPDSSGNAIHGIALAALPGDGVFNRGRVFSRSLGSFITIPMLTIPDHQFTFESWIRPTEDTHPSTEQVLLSTSQIKVARFATGQVRVFINSKHAPFTAETTGLLSLGELHHLAVVWDGKRETNNLVVYVDGVIRAVFDAPGECDFDDTPQTGEIGRNFTGMLDEIRVSKSVRDTFNLTVKQPGFVFQTFQPGTSSTQRFPELHVQINTINPVDPAKVVVRLNGVQQPAGPNLIITATGIDGTLTDALVEGLNVIEVELTDSQGHQIKQSHHVFLIGNPSGAAYVPDTNTVGLWHFEDEQADVMLDSSGNGYDLSSFDPTTVPGHIGRGRWVYNASTGSTVRLGRTRAVTMEGWFKLNSTIQTYEQPNLFRISGSGFDLALLLRKPTEDAAIGDLRMHISTSEGTLDRMEPAVFPMDGALHHVALIYDGGREFAQFVLVVDGQVRASFDYKAVCDFSKVATFRFSESQKYFHIDEGRLSNKARYSFNLGSGQPIPVIDSIAPASGVTIRASSVPVNLDFHSANQAISTSGTFLKVNGARQAQLTLNTAGFAGSLSGTVSGLLEGANEFELHVLDGSGEEQVQHWLVYFIGQGVAQEYAPDANTELLLHFNETTGPTFADSSANGFDFTLSGDWQLGVAGLFGTTGVTSGPQWPSTGAAATLRSLRGVSRMTVEAWLKTSNSSVHSRLLAIPGVFDFAVTGSQELYFSYTSRAGGVLRTAAAIPVDDLFHHLSVILDATHPVRNLYMLVDGSVVASFREKADRVTIDNSSTAALIGQLPNRTLDELRLSSTARYTLNFSPTLIEGPSSLREALSKAWKRVRSAVTFALRGLREGV